MKMAKKFLAVALAGVLALSVLTGCGASVKSEGVAKALTKMDIKAEQSKDVDTIAENTLGAIVTIINSDTNMGVNKVTLDNAVKKMDGKLINGVNITDDTVSKALGLFFSGVDAEKANEFKQVRVALVETKYAEKNATMQAALVKEAMVEANSGNVDFDHKLAETGKLGTAKTKDGKYMLVVIINEQVEKNA